MEKKQPLKKPALRGYLHQEAFFVALGACACLLANASTSPALVASLVYSFGLLMLFGISAVYHRPHWDPKPRAFLKRLDHSAIFVQIAGTFTPICILALSPKIGGQLLLVIWVTAFFGILQSIFWVKAPKYLTAIFYVTMGWFVLPYGSELKESLGTANLALIAAGGIVYTIGAVFYALKRPKLVPSVFGYHELFHLFTIIGAGLHFVVIYRMIR